MISVNDCSPHGMKIIGNSKIKSGRDDDGGPLSRAPFVALAMIEMHMKLAIGARAGVLACDADLSPLLL